MNQIKEKILECIEIKFLNGKCISDLSYLKSVSEQLEFNVEGGLNLILPSGSRLEKSIVFIYENSEMPMSSSFIHRIRLRENASAVFFERYLNISSPSAHNLIKNYFDLEAHSSLEYYLLQPSSSSSFSSTEVKQGLKSYFQAFQVSLGGEAQKVSLLVDVEEAGAISKLLGFCKAIENQKIQYVVTVNHKADHTLSRQFYKAIADQRGAMDFEGKVTVFKDARGVEAHQKNRNLLMSKTASIGTKPQLEIYNDDVVCSHGATIGDLDENEIFYLQSRGLDEDTARHLLMNAFAKEIFQHVSSTPVVKVLQEAIMGEEYD